MPAELERSQRSAAEVFRPALAVAAQDLGMSQTTANRLTNCSLTAHSAQLGYTDTLISMLQLKK